MRLKPSWGMLIALLWIFVVEATAQKVKTGFDKSVDFSRYASYTWADPVTPPARPLLYLNVVGAVDSELQSQKLQRRPNAGDLILVAAGGIEFGLNVAAGAPILPSYGGAPPTLDATMWSGTGGSVAKLTASYVPEGTLILTFVDAKLNKVVWTGTVTEKLDLEKKARSVELINRAITKLLDAFPPPKK